MLLTGLEMAIIDKLRDDADSALNHPIRGLVLAELRLPYTTEAIQALFQSVEKDMSMSEAEKEGYKNERLRVQNKLMNDFKKMGYGDVVEFGTIINRFFNKKWSQQRNDSMNLVTLTELERAIIEKLRNGSAGSRGFVLNTLELPITQDAMEILLEAKKNEEFSSFLEKEVWKKRLMKDEKRKLDAFKSAGYGNKVEFGSPSCTKFL